MSIEQRRTEEVYGIITELVANGKTALRPGDVNSALRERGAPMGTWEMRAVFSELEQEGRLVCDEESGDWHLTENASLKDAG